MIFKRSYKYQSTMPIDGIKSKLLGQHMQIHQMDFEVSEKNGVLRIIPHAERETHLKTLPITHIDLDGKGSKTKVKISSKMRRIDSGGPQLIVIFCLFLLIAAALFFLFGTAEHRSYTYILGGVGLAIFIMFWIKMETGYFDYVRKIRDYIKTQTSAT